MSYGMGGRSGNEAEMVMMDGEHWVLAGVLLAVAAIWLGWEVYRWWDRRPPRWEFIYQSRFYSAQDAGRIAHRRGTHLSLTAAGEWYVLNWDSGSPSVRFLNSDEARAFIITEMGARDVRDLLEVWFGELG